MIPETEKEIPCVSHTRGLWILSPLLVFFLLYVTTSVIVGDFYKMESEPEHTYRLDVYNEKGLVFSQRIKNNKTNHSKRNYYLKCFIF